MLQLECFNEVHDALDAVNSSGVMIEHDGEWVAVVAHHNRHARRRQPVLFPADIAEAYLVWNLLLHQVGGVVESFQQVEGSMIDHDSDVALIAATLAFLRYLEY